MMAAELERARESAVYQTVLDNHAKTHDQTFHTVLPGLLEVGHFVIRLVLFATSFCTFDIISLSLFAIHSLHI